MGSSNNSHSRALDGHRVNSSSSSSNDHNRVYRILVDRHYDLYNPQATST